MSRGAVFFASCLLKYSKQFMMEKYVRNLKDFLYFLQKLLMVQDDLNGIVLEFFTT